MQKLLLVAYLTSLWPLFWQGLSKNNLGSDLDKCANQRIMVPQNYSAIFPIFE